jgi:hypothetical protein
MRCYLGNTDDINSIVYMDISLSHALFAADLAVEMSINGQIIPILDDIVLNEVIDACLVMGFDEWEVISYGGDGVFYTYSLDELGQFDYPINVLGSVGLVVYPQSPIKILFPSAFGIMEKH